jgi:lipopolysaccharide assembly protein A
MKRIYSILVLLIAMLFVVFIIQNAEMVDLTFLIWGLEISKALLMMICAAVGFLIGMLAFSFSSSKKTPEKEQVKKPEESTSHTPS